MDEAELFHRATVRKRRVRLLLLAAIFVAPFAYVGWRIHDGRARAAEREEEYRKSLVLSDAEREALRTSVTGARTTLVAAREAWQRAVAPDALDALAPSERACGVRLTGPTDQAARSYIDHGSIDVNYFGNLHVRRHRKGEPIAPRDLDVALERVGAIAAELDAGKADREDVRALDRIDGHTVLAILDEDVPALVGLQEGIPTYTPARLAGTAYLYAYRERRVICVGDFEVESPASIKFDFSYMPSNILDRDLKIREAATSILGRDIEVRATQAIARSLRAATP